MHILDWELSCYKIPVKDVGPRCPYFNVAWTLYDLFGVKFSKCYTLDIYFDDFCSLIILFKENYNEILVIAPILIIIIRKGDWKKKIFLIAYSILIK